MSQLKYRADLSLTRALPKVKRSLESFVTVLRMKGQNSTPARRWHDISGIVDCPLTQNPATHKHTEIRGGC